MWRSGNASRRYFVLASCLAFALPVGVAAWSAKASDAVRVTAADPGSSPIQPENITVNPPPGMNADPIAQPVSMPADPNKAALIKRGEYLAVAGDCQYCHSVPGGAPFAGGQPVQTPFGDLFTPNLTPDKKYGIGNWTDAQFWNALHYGIGPGHSLLVFPHYLYPLMPWQNYNKLSYPDVMAIKAYLGSIQPLAQPDRPSQMNFPFDIRAGLFGWRLLFFRDHPIRYDASWSPQVRDGAFLVQALGHCSECHTQRNLLMATEPSRYLAGGHILAQSWYAPNITLSKTDGIGGWSSSDLFSYLYRDGAVGPGAPYGPMKQVVDDSLSRLPASSVQDIVAYLQHGTPDLTSDIPPAPAKQVASYDGARLYADNCARCHGGNGEGVDNNFPNLAGNESIWDGPPQNIESMILGGFRPWHAGQSSMPEFNQVLNDGEIAAIANYVRTSWGNKGVADATPENVATERSLTSDWVRLNTGTTVAKLQTGGTSETFDDISGKLEMFSHHQNCMLNAHFTDDAPDAPAKSLYLVGACAKQGSALDGAMVIDGKSYPATLTVLDQGGARLSDILLFGRLPNSNDRFDARIALVSPTY
jgi:mono/diheme cytochrome c family protein